MSNTIVLKSPEDTTEFAAKLALQLVAGDVVLLNGGIGAGKTHFARSLIQSLLTEPEDVPSPTFTLVQIYETDISEIWHADLYRLSSADDCFELGLVDAFSTAICLIEWPDRLGDLAPENALCISIDIIEGDQRQMLLEYTDEKWSAKLGKI